MVVLSCGCGKVLMMMEGSIPDAPIEMAFHQAECGNHTVVYQCSCSAALHQSFIVRQDAMAVINLARESYLFCVQHLRKCGSTKELTKN